MSPVPRTRILFLTGNPKAELLRALALARRDIVAVVVPKSGKYRPQCEEVVAEAASHGIPVVSTGANGLDQALSALDYDLLFSCGFPLKISGAACARAKLAVNFHPTLLPKHRGRYLNHILLDRDEFSGVTAHRIEASYDAGAVIKQVSFRVSPFDTVKSLARKSAQLEIGLVKDVIALYEAGTVAFTPQDERAASAHFDQRTPEDSEIDPAKPLSSLFFEIRACDPELYPAFFYVDGQKVFIKVYRENRPEDEADMI